MVQITATPDQIKAIFDAVEEIEIVDGAGNRLGTVQPLFTRQEIAEAKRRAESSEERRTTAQVLERIRSLEAE